MKVHLVLKKAEVQPKASPREVKKSDDLQAVMKAGSDYDTVQKNIGDAMQKGCSPRDAVGAALKKAGLDKMPAEGRKVSLKVTKAEPMSPPGGGGAEFGGSTAGPTGP